jgi:iron complex transport system ATP-binding protein
VTPAVSIRNLCFAYNRVSVISGISLDLEPGTVTAILGANGVGKTTLLHIILGLYGAATGEIRYFGKDRSWYGAHRIRRLVGMVSQNETIPFDLSVADYVLLGRAPHLGVLSMPGEADTAAAREALVTVGMSHKSEHPVTRLSSGEKQLVHIARALSQDPKLLLLDEPCSHLDLINTRKVLNLMKSIAADGCTVVFSTHDPGSAAASADQVILLEKGGIVAQGGVTQTLTSDLLTRTYGDTVIVVPTDQGLFIRTL